MLLMKELVSFDLMAFQAKGRLILDCYVLSFSDAGTLKVFLCLSLRLFLRADDSSLLNLLLFFILLIFFSSSFSLHLLVLSRKLSIPLSLVFSFPFLFFFSCFSINSFRQLVQSGSRCEISSSTMFYLLCLGVWHPLARLLGVRAEDDLLWPVSGVIWLGTCIGEFGFLFGNQHSIISISKLFKRKCFTYPNNKIYQLMLRSLSCKNAIFCLRWILYMQAQTSEKNSEFSDPTQQRYKFEVERKQNRGKMASLGTQPGKIRWVHLTKTINDGWTDKLLTIRMALSPQNELHYLQCEGHCSQSLMLSMVLLSQRSMVLQEDVLMCLQALCSTGELLERSGTSIR